MQADESIFAEIAKSNFWGSDESISGPGSTLEVTESLRRGLEVHLPALGIKSLVDAPCGDLNWIRHLQYRFERYIGIDLVPEIIEKLKKLALPRHHFQTGNIITDILPAADAILCRDCLVHLPFEAAKTAMHLMSRSGCRYIMATTFPHLQANVDILLGQWRMLNLQAPPFNLPAPVILIHDGDHHIPPYNDKSLGIWRAEDFKPAA